MNSYHFDVGNSTSGHIGMCARIKAESREEAVEILKEVLPEEVHFAGPMVTGDQDPRVEYINFYVNTDAITVKDIDDEEECDEEQEEEATC